MSDKATIRVFIADDHAIVREGLKQILAEQRDVIVAGEAETGLDAVKLVGKARPHVMLLDISLPDRNGIEVLKQIKKDRPELAVLMLSMHREDQYAIRSLKAGAAGYMTKQSAPRTSARRWRRPWRPRSAKTTRRRRTTPCPTANTRP